jgi:hypothetical protein
MEKLNELSDREETAVTTLLEEYKARWQHLLNLDNEVNKWSASYVIALVVGVSWILSSEKFKGIDELFSARNYDNAYFILSLAVVNAAYMLSLAFKGYQIQQICYYLHTVVAANVIRITGITFNTWEVWRRSAVFCSPKRIGKSEWRRSVYYPIVTLMPFAVSDSILWMYVNFAGKNLAWSDPHNLYFYLVVAINLLAGFIALSTAGFNKKWEILTLNTLNKSDALIEDGKDLQSQLQPSSDSAASLVTASTTIKPDRRISDTKSLKSTQKKSNSKVTSK